MGFTRLDIAVVSAVYWALRRVLEFLVLCHQLAILRRQVARPGLRPADRAVLAGLSRVLPRGRWAAFFVRPETLLAWHRGLVKRRCSYSGRPCRSGLRELVRRLASDGATGV
jgi:hypothetical protein